MDLLVGHTRDEHRLFSLIDGVLGQVTDEMAETALRILAPGAHGAGRNRAAFPGAGPEELYELVNGDWLFRMPTMHLAAAHAAAGGRTHVYELTWPAPAMGGALGACHGLDVPLVFGNLGAGEPGLLIGDPAPVEAEVLSARVRAAWTAFADGGDPGWPSYDDEVAAGPAPRCRVRCHRLPGGGLPVAVAEATFRGLPLVGVPARG